jgi:hypothetical protein
MFLSSWQSVEADTHRQHLLAEAEAHRLGKVAKAARHVAKPADPPPESPPPGSAPEKNSHANRRYAVSR